MSKAAKNQRPPAGAPQDAGSEPKKSGPAKWAALSAGIKRRALSVGFRGIMTAILIVAVAGVGFVTLKTSHKLLSENKLRDVWAILFLELERRAGELSLQLTKDAPAAEATVVDVDKSGAFSYVSGAKLPVARLADLGVELLEDLTPWNLVFDQRDAKLGDAPSRPANPPTAYVAAWDPAKKVRRLTISRFLGKIRLPNAAHVASTSYIYVASRQGRLLYTNTPVVSQRDFLRRTLVQKFITLPAWQGQMDLVDQDGAAFYGFFHEVPGTNLTVFAETSKATVTKVVTAATRRLVVALLMTIGGAILLLQVPLYFLLRPVRNLVRLAEMVAAGNFDIKPETHGFGEVYALSHAFGAMIGALKRRDVTISALMREQVDKVRLEAEIALARSIQDSLLPIEPLAAASGLELAARYRPASEVAGDWYGYFYDEQRRASVIAIVDISGHGAGASMFTAITASIFEEFRVTFAAGGAAPTFFENLNRNLRRYGRGKWSATAQVVVYLKDEAILEVFNAGHPPTILSSPAAADADAAGAEFSVLRRASSDLLGMQPELALAVQRVPFPAGRAAVLYTDGLSERRDLSGKVFGMRRIARTLGKIPRQAPESLIEGLMNAADAHARRPDLDDDVCVVVLRAAA